MSISIPKRLLSRELVRLGAAPADKQQAIAEAAQLLVAGGVCRLDCNARVR